jgi:hypothetical protein
VKRQSKDLSHGISKGRTRYLRAREGEALIQEFNATRKYFDAIIACSLLDHGTAWEGRMKSLKVMYRDGTEITIRQSEGEGLKPGEHEAEAEGLRGKEPKPKGDEGESDPGKPCQSPDDSDWGLFPAFRAPLQVTNRFDSVHAMIAHVSRLEPAGDWRARGPVTFAIKDAGLNPFAARRIFKRLPDGMHVTIVGDYDA